MKKIILAASFITVFSMADAKENKVYENELTKRMTCTIHVPDGFGGYLALTATAGNIFDSSTSAAVKACKKVGQMALNFLMDAS